MKETTIVVNGKQGLNHGPISVPANRRWLHCLRRQIGNRTQPKGYKMESRNFIDDLFFALFGWPSTVPVKEEAEFAPFKLEFLNK
jgi:hypothetical protein